MNAIENQVVEPPQRRRLRRMMIVSLAIGAVVTAAVGAYLAYVRPWEATAGVEKPAGSTGTYTCPMHPQVEKDRPGVCPICFMDLVPKAIKVQPAANEHEGHELGSETIALTERARVIADVATTTIMSRSISTIITTTAGVDYNETSQHQITARFAGRVERLYVDRTGQYVAKGSPLMEIYSPELVTAQQDYLITRETPQLELAASAGGEQSSRRDRMLQAARRRLELLGMTTRQIDALNKRGEISYTTTVFANASGIVVRRGITDGGYLATGALIVELVDLSSVYVIANVNESVAWKVRPGQSFSISGVALGNEQLTGQVNYIYPAVDAASRTVRVRAIMQNKGLRLKPGMFVTARIGVPGGDVLVVPADAVVRTGRRDLIYVEVGRNMFEPREVRLGQRDGDYMQILSGASAGDRIVAKGGYLLDAERRLSSTGAADPHAGHGTKPAANADTAAISPDEHAGH